jgi:hypothetical protein
LEDSWQRAESLEYLIYLAFYEILRGPSAGDRLRGL